MGIVKYNWLREEIELRVKLKELPQQDRRELIDDLIRNLCDEVGAGNRYWIAFAKDMLEELELALRSEIIKGDEPVL